MTGAMYAAVSGLKAHMSALNVIGQNISNVNTNAYKATRYTFLEALYTSVRGGSDGSNLLGGKNPAQVGYGSSIGTIDLDMSTKNYTPTGRPTDIMIDGDGMLIVGDKGATFGSTTGNKELKDMYLTRLGNLEFDPNGYLVDGQGQVVYGFLAVESPAYKAAVAYGNTIEADKGVDALKNIKDITDAEIEAAYGATSPVFYVNDKDQIVMLTPKKLGDGQTAPAPPKLSDLDVTVVEQYIEAPVLTPIRAPMANADGGASYPTWDRDPASATYGQIIDSDQGAGRIVKHSVSIDENTGRITCTTENGEAVVIGAIAIAQVENPNGLTHVDGHYYQALGGAGRVTLTSVGHAVKNSSDPLSLFYMFDENGEVIPEDQRGKTIEGESGISSSGSTKVISNGLESSGTDLANEISNMIMIQRGYQANTRIVTVTDSMLEELVNMKR